MAQPGQETRLDTIHTCFLIYSNSVSCHIDAVDHPREPIDANDRPARMLTNADIDAVNEEKNMQNLSTLTLEQLRQRLKNLNKEFGLKLSISGMK